MSWVFSKTASMRRSLRSTMKMAVSMFVPMAEYTLWMYCS